MTVSPHAAAGARRAVVLGHTGFVGRALHTYLVGQGVDVRGYGSAGLDLRHADALAALDGVLNPETVLVVCAAITPDRGQTIDQFAENVAMAVNLGRWLKGHPAGKLVYVSTDAVYPMTDGAISEATPVRPEGFYPLAKHVVEQALGQVAAEAKLPLLILRPVSMFGPGDTHNSYGPNRFVRQVVAERSVRLFGEGDDERDHLYVEDAARLIGTLALGDVTGTLNLATGVSRSFGSIVEQLQAIAPYPFQVVRQPRSGPASFRPFDIGQLAAAIPGLTFTDFQTALRTTFNAAQGAG